jgi:hypothetical protein
MVAKKKEEKHPDNRVCGMENGKRVRSENMDTSAYMSAYMTAYMGANVTAYMDVNASCSQATPDQSSYSSRR